MGGGAEITLAPPPALTKHLIFIKVGTVMKAQSAVRGCIKTLYGQGEERWGGGDLCMN